MFLITFHFIFESYHEKTCFCHLRTIKAQISQRIQAILAKSKRLKLASEAEQASLCLTW